MQQCPCYSWEQRVSARTYTDDYIKVIYQLPHSSVTIMPHKVMTLIRVLYTYVVILSNAV